MVPPSQRVGHRWRDYRSSSGRRPVRQFIDTLADEDAAEVAAAMADVRQQGLRVARHLRGDIYEVRADGPRASVRILFAQEGRKGRVLLALEGFEKKTQKTPDRLIRIAEKRLVEWRSR
jgi:phage-related protein